VSHIPIVLPAIVAVIYAITAVWHFFNQQYGLSLMWVSYAIANVGLILAGRGV